MQSPTSTESPVSVPIDVRVCSSINERERAERRETSNFLCILSNISCSYVVNVYGERERETPHSFSQRIYTIWKNDS